MEFYPKKYENEISNLTIFLQAIFVAVVVVTIIL